MLNRSAPLSRVDKLRVDRDGIAPEESSSQRAASVPQLAVGDDASNSEMLQVMALTAVNLANKSFNAKVPVLASESLWNSRSLTGLTTKPTFGEALAELGATKSQMLVDTRLTLVLGEVEPPRRAIRMTFDGWLVGVGPASTFPRWPERALCPLAAVAAAAIGVGEAFSNWAGINVMATRQDIKFSLWHPGTDVANREAQGDEVLEFPEMLEFFGVGHLGQAYLWAMTSLPFADRSSLKPYLCDDDEIEEPNVETGALLCQGSIGEPKTRVVADWLRVRGIKAKLIERFIDQSYVRAQAEPQIALSGFDNNEARQWVSTAGFTRIIDAGLGGEACNFDSIAIRSWPHDRDAQEIWPVETIQQRQAREAHKRELAASNRIYANLAPDECGRLLVANKAVAVPFVGALAACFALAEVLRACNGGPTFFDGRTRVCSMGTAGPTARISAQEASPLRGIRMVALRVPE